jgi:hypothetical protein
MFAEWCHTSAPHVWFLGVDNEKWGFFNVYSLLSVMHFTVYPNRIS